MTRMRSYSYLRSWLPLQTLLLLTLFALPTRAQTPDPIVAALTAHGGALLPTVARVQMRGQSFKGGTPQPVTISASFNGADAGSLRVDYGSPVTQSFYNTPRGAAVAAPGQLTVFKSAQVGAFAQYDILAGLGIQHLAAPSVQRTVSPSAVNGRAASKVRAITGRSQTIYRRAVADDLDVDVDAETNLVAAITRRQIAEGAMDLTFLAGFRFSDYRSVQGILFPFRIERVLNGVVSEVVQLDAVDVNPFLSTRFFSPPDNDYRRNPLGRITRGGR